MNAKKIIIEFLKSAYSFFNSVVYLLGFMLLAVLVVCGIAKTPLSIIAGQYGIADGNLSPLTMNDEAIMFLRVVLIVVIIGYPIVIYKEIKRVVNKYRVKNKNKCMTIEQRVKQEEVISK